MHIVGLLGQPQVEGWNGLLDAADVWVGWGGWLVGWLIGWFAGAWLVG